ncbi:alpha/beta fold hydrolase [Arenibacterium sp. LLYu02]|uniref:alpha/beta fold hydrolase n=1 Tax=Arenibacterium sp. LLYu02 TaxID=3404132 RepID=UPI003B22019F
MGDWDVAVECAGPTSANVTVWLEHGIGTHASSSTWDHVFVQTAEFAQVCRYDRPGAGMSAQSASYGPNIYLSRVNALMRVVGAQKQLIVVGHSFGGYPTRILAQTWPERVREVILVDSISEVLGLRAATNAAHWADVPVGRNR